MEILLGLDAVDAQIRQLEGKISRKTAEGQFENILAQLHAQAAVFVKALGGEEALRSLRTERRPPAEGEWWYLDEWLAQVRKSRRRLALFGGVGVLLALGAVIAVYVLFLKPDPKVAARQNHENAARNYISQGNLPQALDELNQSLQYAPDDPSLLALKGVILTQQGQAAEANQVFAQAEQDSASREEFLSWRGEAYILLGQADPALADSQAILQANAQSFEGYILAGEAYEIKKAYSKALDAFGQAYDLADAQGQSSQAATAKMHMTNILQQIEVPTGPALTPTPGG